MKIAPALLISLLVLLAQPAFSRQGPPTPQIPPPPGLPISGTSVLFFAAILYLLYISKKITDGR